MPVYQRFPLPDAGEGLTEADIVEWRVAVGDAVTVNQVIVEIETAKSLVELPSPWTGVVTEILVEVGVTANVGDPIIVIDTDPTGILPDDGAPQGAGAEAVGAATAADQASGEASAASASGSVLVGYGVQDAGTKRRKRNAGGEAPAAPAPVAVVAPAALPAVVPPVLAPVTAAASTSVTSAVSVPNPLSAQRVLAKPPVRKLARDLGIDISGVIPTGPGGIVTREDVLAHQVQASAQSMTTYDLDDQPWLADGKVTPDGRQTRVPVKSVRKRTAEAMVTSAFTAPHVTVFQTVDVTKTMKLVAKLREDREFAGVRVTPLLIAAKALLLAVNRQPEINASWDEASREIVYKHYVNLGIAAATPRGLMVPNIKDAHRLSLLGLASSLGDLTSTARAGKTTLQDMSDGTITITNVGVFGIDTGTPILNPGEAAILAFGAIREQPWAHKGKIKLRHVTQLALSFDHRLVDGALGAKLLSDVAAVMEEPSRGLVWG